MTRIDKTRYFAGILFGFALMSCGPSEPRIPSPTTDEAFTAAGPIVDTPSGRIKVVNLNLGNRGQIWLFEVDENDQRVALTANPKDLQQAIKDATDCTPDVIAFSSAGQNVELASISANYALDGSSTGFVTCPAS